MQKLSTEPKDWKELPEKKTAFRGEDGFLHIVVPVIAKEGVDLPTYHTDEAACCDIVAQIPTDESGASRVALNHRSSIKVATGLRMAIPKGYKLCFAARSSFAEKGLIVTNSPAQIDSDFRDEVKVMVLNVGREIVEIKQGDRIAQCWIEPVIRITWETTDTLPDSDRTGGFGSTGR